MLDCLALSGIESGEEVHGWLFAISLTAFDSRCFITQIYEVG